MKNFRPVKLVEKKPSCTILSKTEKVSCMNCGGPQYIRGNYVCNKYRRVLVKVPQSTLEVMREANPELSVTPYIEGLIVQAVAAKHQMESSRLPEDSEE